MAVCNRERVLDRDHQLAFGNDPPVLDVAEDAAVRSLAITSGRAARIGHIAVALHCTSSRVPEGWSDRRSRQVPRNDVIDLTGATFGAHAIHMRAARNLPNTTVAQLSY